MGHRPRRNLRPRPDAELVADPLDMALSGPFGDEQTLGYLLVGHAGRHHGGHLAFATAQRTRVRRCVNGLAGPTGGVIERLRRGHGQRVGPDLVASARPELLADALGALVDLVDPGRP